MKKTNCDFIVISCCCVSQWLESDNCLNGNLNFWILSIPFVICNESLCLPALLVLFQGNELYQTICITNDCACLCVFQLLQRQARPTSAPSQRSGRGLSTPSPHTPSVCANTRSCTAWLVWSHHSWAGNTNTLFLYPGCERFVFDLFIDCSSVSWWPNFTPQAALYDSFHNY